MPHHIDISSNDFQGWKPEFCLTGRLSWTKRSNDGNIRLSKHYGYVYASQKEIVAFFPGMARFPSSHKQNWVRVVHSRLSHCGHSLHRDVDKLWKPLSRNNLQESTLGKDKAFFQCCVSSQEAAGVVGWHRTKGQCIRQSFFWPLHLHKCSISCFDHYPTTPHAHQSLISHLSSCLASCSLSFSCPMYARHITQQSSLSPFGLSSLLLASVLPPKLVTSTLLHFHRIVLLSTHLH